MKFINILKFLNLFYKIKKLKKENRNINFNSKKN